MRKALMLSLLLAGGGVWTLPAAAETPFGGLQQACHKHTRVVELLRREFEEEPRALGLQANGQLLELFVSKERESWTLVSTRPDGVSCIVAVGEHWESLPDPLREPVA